MINIPIDGEVPGNRSANDAVSENSAWRPTSDFWWVYASLALSMLLSALDQTIVATALPTVVGDLGSVSLMSWVVTVYTLAVTISMPVYGKFGDLIGRRGLYLIALGLFVVGSALCGFSQNVAQLIFFRAIQGIGGGGLLVLSQSILAELIPPRERPRYMAPLGAVFGLASVLGPLVGGVITDHWSWHWIFWINLPLGIFALAVNWWKLKVPTRNLQFSIDYAGIALMAVAVVAISLLSSWAGTHYAWTSPQILGLAAITIAAGIGFVWAESRASDPIIPIRLFSDLSFSIPTVLGIAAALGMFAAVSYMPTYLQMVYGVSATVSGYFILPMIGGTMITSALSGAVISRTGHYRIFPIAGMALIGFALFLLSTANPQTSIWLLAAYLGVLGIGLGCVLQVLVLIVQNAVPMAELGTATSANNFFREIGATVGIALVGALFTARLFTGLEGVDLGAVGQISTVEELTPAIVAALPAGQQEIIVNAYASALTPVFGYLAPVFIVAVLIAFFMPGKRKSDQAAV